MSVIQLTQNLVFHVKTKHFEVRYHFVREVLEEKRKELVKVHKDNNSADMLMKSQPTQQF